MANMFCSPYWLGRQFSIAFREQSPLEDPGASPVERFHEYRRAILATIFTIYGPLEIFTMLVTFGNYGSGGYSAIWLGLLVVRFASRFACLALLVAVYRGWKREHTNNLILAAWAGTLAVPALAYMATPFLALAADGIDREPDPDARREKERVLANELAYVLIYLFAVAWSVSKAFARTPKILLRIGSPYAMRMVEVHTAVVEFLFAMCWLFPIFQFTGLYNRLSPLFAAFMGSTLLWPLAGHWAGRAGTLVYYAMMLAAVAIVGRDTAGAVGVGYLIFLLAVLYLLNFGLESFLILQLSRLVYIALFLADHTEQDRPAAEPASGYERVALRAEASHPAPRPNDVKPATEMAPDLSRSQHALDVAPPLAPS